MPKTTTETRQRRLERAEERARRAWYLIEKAQDEYYAALRAVYKDGDEYMTFDDLRA